jgi:hypothetical protein
LPFKSRQGTNRRKPLTVKALSNFAKYFTGHQWLKLTMLFDVAAEEIVRATERAQQGIVTHGGRMAP